MKAKGIRRNKQRKKILIFAPNGLITYNEWKMLINKYSS
jgi:hypothetical protein